MLVFDDISYRVILVSGNCFDLSIEKLQVFPFKLKLYIAKIYIPLSSKSLQVL